MGGDKWALVWEGSLLVECGKRNVLSNSSKKTDGHVGIHVGTRHVSCRGGGATPSETQRICINHIKNALLSDKSGVKFGVDP